MELSLRRNRVNCHLPLLQTKGGRTLFYFISELMNINQKKQEILWKRIIYLFFPLCDNNLRLVTTMKKLTVIFLLVVLLGTCGIFASLEFYIGASSYYIWRGFDLNPINELMINPYANIILSDTGFSITAWGSYALDKKEMRELDLTLTFAFNPIRRLLVKLGYTEYRFFNIPNHFFKSDSREFFISFGLPWTLFQPEVVTYYDFGAGNGLYFQFKLRHAISLLKHINLEFYSALGYNAGQWLPAGAKTGFSDFNFTAMLPIKLGKIYVIPFASYSATLLDSIGDSRYFWYGITFGY